MITIFASDVALLIQFKAKNKLYNTAHQEATATADPFDQVELQPGNTFSVDGEVVAVRELTPAAALGGTPE